MKPSRCGRIFFMATLIAFLMLWKCVLWAQHKPRTEAEKALAEDFGRRATATLNGEIFWPGKDLSQATVQVYKDENLKSLYTGVTGLIGGEFKIRVEPGRYYLVAFVDLDRSGQFDIGDGMGIFGILDWNHPDQRKQLVSVEGHDTSSWLVIPITARMQSVNRKGVPSVDGKGKIIAEYDYLPIPLVEFKKEVTKITSGIKGLVERKGNKSFENALVFAYTDLSWKYRAGSAGIADDGSFTLKLTPGKYYLMVTVDENRTNLFDYGDELGIYGIDDLRNRRAFPEPILVKANRFTKDIRIEVTGKQTESGKIVSLAELGTEARSTTRTTAPATAMVSGEVVWAGQSLKGSVIQVYQDPALVKIVKRINTDENGGFNLQLPPGDYYLIANVDVDGDGRYSQGDGIGAYGSTDMTNVPPSALMLKPATNPDIILHVSARYRSDGQLEAFRTEDPNDLSQDTGGRITGRIIWTGQVFKEGILSLSETPDFESPMAIALNLEDDGRYEVPVPPGGYYLMVVVDVDGDRKAGLRDGVGIYGTRYPVRGKPQLVSVFVGHTTPYVDIEIFARYIDEEGNMAEIEDGHRSEIRLRYGDPEDVFNFTRFGREIEQWWYWTQGVGFSFEAIGGGWRLQDHKDFEPKKVTAQMLKELEAQSEKSGDESTNLESEPLHSNEESQPELGLLNAIIYYSYDDIIWGYAPNGTLQPFGAGRRPSASLEDTLTYIDLEGNVMVRDLSGEEAGLLLSKRELASDAAISPDGRYIAFTRRSINRSRIYIRHLPGQEEILIPSTAREMFTPTWNRSGELLAYSSRGSIENPEAGSDRNIYAYDTLTQRLEPICISPEDDAEPAWSPSNPNVLAFSRAEDEFRQIWITEFSSEGEPAEKQLTRYGGQNPIWLPDGSMILYENNGQLWIVSKDGSDNHPLRFKGKVVYGHEPYAIPVAAP